MSKKANLSEIKRSNGIWQVEERLYQDWQPPLPVSRSCPSLLNRALYPLAPPLASWPLPLWHGHLSDQRSSKFEILLAKIFSLEQKTNQIHAFFINITFISDNKVKLAKNQEAKVELRLNFCYLKIIHFLHPCYHPKLISDILKKCAKNKGICFNYLINYKRKAENEKWVR